MARKAPHVDGNFDSESKSQFSNGEVKETVKSFAFQMTVFSLSLLGFMAAIDSVSTTAALPSIVLSLTQTGETPSTTAAYWVSTGYLLSQTVLMPLFSSASEIAGRKLCVLTAITLFLVGSILCGTAQTIYWLIGARVVR